MLFSNYANMNSSERCSIEDFAVYFLNFIRNQTEEHMKGNLSTCITPRKPTGPGINSEFCRTSTKSKKIVCDIFGGDNLNTSTNLADDGINPFESDATTFFTTPKKNNFTYNSPCRNSTPVKTDLTCSKSELSQYSFDRISAYSPQASPINQLRSGEKSSFRKSYNSSSLCLSDFMSPSTSKVKTRKNAKDNSQNKSENSSILSESEFPAIGKRTPKSCQKINTSTTSVCNNSKDNSINVTPTANKPRKRVAPISVKTTAENNFGSIAYRTDNNLLTINNDDTKISRDLLKTQIDAIAKELKNESLPDRPMHTYGQLKQKNDIGSSQSVQIDLTKVTQEDVLNRMIRIYTVIIDSNLTTNCLAEISFLLNLLNAEFSHQQQQLTTFEESTTEALDESVDELIEPYLINRQYHISSSLIFKNIHNCVYFSAGVLSKQKHLLMLLDITTIKVLMDNERLMEHGECMKKFLTNVYTHKLQLDKCSSHDVSFKQGGGDNVFYQEDDDTKEHFPSMREFSSFKNQRDGFYNVLRIWESNHFNPSWDFVIEVGHKILSLFAIMRHPINMAHMAKLFTSQLILSCNFEDASSDLQQALPQIDPTKLSKLQQRLIAPSFFATDYMYPGTQAFFRDFLAAADSEIIFIEQLKIVLINELLGLNNSSYETLRLSSANKKSPHFDEYVVRPETVATMRVLAKFLGLIYVKPFAYDGTRSLGVDTRQIELRNMAYPPFDIKGILKKSIDDCRFIVTIPWLVQFLSMLDYVTLRLNYFVDILHTLFEVYIMATDINLNQNDRQIRPTSLFIIKSCLGWLFEQPNVPIDEYYKYRQNRSTIQPQSEMCWVQILAPKSLSDQLNNKKFMIAAHQLNIHFNTIQCTLERTDAELNHNSSLTVSMKQRSEDQILATFDPMMENILNAACPFIRDFRVSIMPLKYSKTVSRSGKYRHITTKTATESKFTKDGQDQTKLAEAFLQSQSLSVRRTIEFVIERTVSAVIKDFQIEILIPTKKQVNETINSINETEKRKLSNGMYERYINAQIYLAKKWDEVIPGMIRNRVEKALDALLPNETLSIVKQTCTNLAVQKCKLKTTEWKNLNFVGVDFFTKDLSGDANKIIKMRSLFGKQPNVLHFEFSALRKCPSNMLSQLQIELHHGSMCPERLNLSKIENLINDLTSFLSTGVLPSPICKTICLSSLNLVLLLVCNRSDLIQTDLLDKFIKLWHCNALEFWTKPIDDNENNVPHQSDNIPTYTPIETKQVFSNMINNCLMHKLANCPSTSFEALEKLLIVLIKENFLTIPLLNEQFVTLLREEWQEEVLQQLSNMISNVVKTTQMSDDRSECLFMEMLSDLSRDLVF